MQQACKDCESSSQTTETDKQLNLQIFENIKRENKHMTQNDIELIKNSFKQYSYFFQLQDSQVDQIIKNMFYCTQIGEEYIYKNDDQASLIFVIEKGQVQMKFNDKDQNVRIRKEGDFFGELYFFRKNNKYTRNTSIKTISECSFWCIDIQTYKKLVRQSSQKEDDDARIFIDQVPFFQVFTSQERDLMAHELQYLQFASGSVLVNEGDQADSYYIIFSGQISFWRNNLEIRKMFAKDSFGEQALYSKSTSDATVRADSEVICLCLKRHQIMRLFGDQVQIIIFRNMMRQSIEQSPVLINLTKLQIEQIVLNAQISNYKNGQVIIEGNKTCDKLIVVLEGSIINKKQYNITKGQCFGDYYLSETSRSQIIETDYVMVGDGVLATIPFAKLFQILGGDLETALKKNENGHEKKIQQLGDRADASHIKVEDLIFIKKLGQGQFGWVYLVKHKEIDKAYVLKSVSKRSIIEKNLEKHILQEKAVLKAVNFPFIMQLVRTFKDEISVYFLFEFVNGMELFYVIREIGLLKKYDTQFYIATMVLCLEYLHSRSIIYRDLKPENIIINEQGYMNLNDFGTANILTKQHRYRSCTIIGTPHYMAPEIILGKGYTFSGDLWGVGICMYEFQCGGVPYAEDAEDPYQIYEEIMNTQLTFPKFLRDKMAIKLMEQLLSRQPEARLGASYSALKANPWFDDLDFDKLFNRELKAPYIPPKEKLISEEEIQLKFQKGKTVISQMKSEYAEKIQYEKEQAKNPNWDENF